MDTEKPNALHFLVCFWGYCHLSQALFLENVAFSVYFAHGIAFSQVPRLIEILLQTFLSSLDSIFTAQNKPWGAYYTETPGLQSKPTESQSPLVVPMLLCQALLLQPTMLSIGRTRGVYLSTIHQSINLPNHFPFIYPFTYLSLCLLFFSSIPLSTHPCIYSCSHPLISVYTFN